MKKNEKELLREKSIKELEAEREKEIKNLLLARFQHAQGKLKNVKKIARIRDEIAVIKTLIREKQLMEAK